VPSLFVCTRFIAPDRATGSTEVLPASSRVIFSATEWRGRDAQSYATSLTCQRDVAGRQAIVGAERGIRAWAITTRMIDAIGSDQ